MTTEMTAQEMIAQEMMMRAGQADHSPCVGHCTYDAADLCLSCRRHTDEITAWRDGADDMRIAAWARIPAEIDMAGIDVMRLPLSPEDIAAIAIARLDEGGAWAVGGDADGDKAWVYAHDLTHDDDGVLTAEREDGAARITLDLSGKMRALAWARHDRKLADGVDELPLLIVVPRARIKDAAHDAPTMMDDGRMDLGYGLTGLQVIKDGDDLVLASLLAEACIDGGADTPPAITSPLPQGLDLPESYVLAAVILPKGEAEL